MIFIGFTDNYVDKHRGEEAYVLALNILSC